MQSITVHEEWVDAVLSAGRTHGAPLHAASVRRCLSVLKAATLSTVLVWPPNTLNIGKSHSKTLIKKPQRVPKRKPTWFGAAVAAATGNAPEFPCHPHFPTDLREVLEPHIEKCRVLREQGLQRFRNATGASAFDNAMDAFKNTGLAAEADLTYCARRFPIRKSFLEAVGLPLSTDLTKIHESAPLQSGSVKDHMLTHLVRFLKELGNMAQI